MRATGAVWVAARSQMVDAALSLVEVLVAPQRAAPPRAAPQLALLAAPTERPQTGGTPSRSYRHQSQRNRLLSFLKRPLPHRHLLADWPRRPHSCCWSASSADRTRASLFRCHHCRPRPPRQVCTQKKRLGLAAGVGADWRNGEASTDRRRREWGEVCKGVRATFVFQAHWPKNPKAYRLRQCARSLAGIPAGAGCFLPLQRGVGPAVQWSCEPAAPSFCSAGAGPTNVPNRSRASCSFCACSSAMRWLD